MEAHRLQARIPNRKIPVDAGPLVEQQITAGLTLAQIGQQWGVSASAVSQFARRRRWPDEVHTCGECLRTFSALQGLRVHTLQAHQWTVEERKRASETLSAHMSARHAAAAAALDERNAEIAGRRKAGESVAQLAADMSLSQATISAVLRQQLGPQQRHRTRDELVRDKAGTPAQRRRAWLVARRREWVVQETAKGRSAASLADEMGVTPRVVGAILRG